MRMFQGFSYSDSEFEEKFGSSRSKAAPTAPERQATPAPSMMSDAEKQNFIASLMAGVGKVLKRELAARDTEIAALRLRVAQMEARMNGKGLPTWAGIYSRGTTYPKGSIVAESGAGWIAEEATAERPGDGATKWRLIMKAPRNGTALMPRPPGVAEPRR